VLTLLFSLYVFLAYPGRAIDRSAGADIPPQVKLGLLKHLVPPLVIFGIVMGSIYGGLATPTESAALGVMAALFFVWRSGRLSGASDATASSSRPARPGWSCWSWSARFC
jgi:C4-dicarboxylate transporter, DctM subunit